MGIVWYVFQKLEIKANANFIYLWHLREHTVVISFSPAQAVPVAVECHAWYYRHVNAMKIGEQPARWFHYAVTSNSHVLPAGVKP